jgi:flagellin-like protein
MGDYLNKKRMIESPYFSLRKKGLSPVIATVLLITLAIVLVGIIFLWMRGFVSEQIEKQGKPSDQVCQEIDFAIEHTYNPLRNTIDLQIVNRGNVNIYGLDIKFIGVKDSSLKFFKLGANVGESSEVQLIPLVVEVKELIVYPMLLGSVKGKKITKPYTCLNNGKTLKIA